MSAWITLIIHSFFPISSINLSEMHIFLSLSKLIYIFFFYLPLYSGELKNEKTETNLKEQAVGWKSDDSESWSIFVLHCLLWIPKGGA